MFTLNASAMVLLGGHSLRMGSDKALLRIGAQTFLGHIAHKLATLTDDVLIVGRYKAEYAEAVSSLPVRFVADSFENCGPLGGLHAGLQAMQYSVGVVVACDMLLVNVELLKHMAELLGEYDAVVPRDEDGWHPLHAVYRQGCATPIEQMLYAGDLRVQNLIAQLNVRTITPDEIAAFDPRGLSLMNLNTPEDLAALKGFRTL